MKKLGLALSALVLAPALASAADGARVTYDRGTKIEIPAAGFDMKLNTEIATYYSFSGGNNGYNNHNSFDVTRADLAVTGHVLNKNFTYHVRYRFGASDVLDYTDYPSWSNNAKDELREAWIQWNPNENTYVRAGRQNYQFGLQTAMDENGYMFATRALPTQSLNRAAWDIVGNGVTVATAVRSGECDALSIVAGIFNGYDDYDMLNGYSDRDTDVQGLLAINYIGNGYDRSFEGDYYQTKNLAWTLGLSGSYAKFDSLPNSYWDYGTEAYAVSLDFGVKKRGFSFQAEAIFKAVQDSPGQQYIGYYAQAGYFVVPEKVELGLRYAGMYFDRSAYSDWGYDKNASEISAIANIYLAGPALKWQVGGSWYKVPGYAGYGGIGESNTQYRVLTGLVGNF